MGMIERNRYRVCRAVCRAEDLVLVAPAPPPDSPPLEMGDWCRLNSGGPAMLVVDVEPEHVTAAWGPKWGEEERFARAVVRRCAAPENAHDCLRHIIDQERTGEEPC